MKNLKRKFYRNDFNNPIRKQVNFGYDLNAIQAVVDHLRKNYNKEDQDYILHIQRGEDLPNAITFTNTALQRDHDLNDMLNVAQSEEDRYEAYNDQVICVGTWCDKKQDYV